MARLAIALATAMLAAVVASQRTDRLAFGGALNAATGYTSHSIFAEFNATAFLELGERFGDTMEESWPVPSGNHPFKHVYASWNPQGHPAFDGHGGGYGVPHMDLHFFVVTAEEREAKAKCSSFPPCPVDNTSAAIYDFPPPAVVAPDFYIDETFGGHGVPGHGMHWLWKGDLPLTTPLGTGTEPVAGPPNWLPCLVQATGGPDAGCRLADWYPGLTPIYISLDGKTAAHEAMFSKDFLRRVKSGLISNPYKLSYPATERLVTDNVPPKYPSAIVAEYDAETDIVRFTLELVDYSPAVCPKKCQSCNENFECLKCSDLVKVNGKCVEKQSCMRLDDGSYCQSEDGACIMQQDGTPVMCQEEDGCAFIDSRCEACDLKYRSSCTRCETGYAPNGNGRKCVPDAPL